MSPALLASLTEAFPGRIRLPSCIHFDRCGLLIREQAHIDFLIVVPTAEELEAVLGRLSPIQTETFEGDPWHYLRTDLPLPLVPGQDAAASYRLVVLPLRERGQKRAVTATLAGIRRYSPRYVLLVGIVGGIAKNGVRIGDVLVADPIYDYEFQIITENGAKPRPRPAQVDQPLLYAVDALKSGPWAAGCDTPRPHPEPEGPPRCHIGPVASGEKLIQDSAYFNEILPQVPNLLGCEMEAAGVCKAVADTPAELRPGFLMIRGISDLADSRKLTRDVRIWRPYACNVAACFLLALLRSRPVSTSDSSQPSPLQVEAALRDYQQRIERTLGWADQRGVEGANRVEHVAQLRLYDVYVLPELLPESGEQELLKKEQEIERALRDALDDTERQKLGATLDAVRKDRWRPRNHGSPVRLKGLLSAHRHLVILGGPGSGKSTLLRYLALEQLRPVSSETEDTEIDGVQSPPEQFLPIHVSLPDFADALAKERSLIFSVFLERSLGDPGSSRVLLSIFRERLASGLVLVLCDGLDEVAEAQERDRVVQSLDSFLADQPKVHLVVASRIYGYTRLRGTVTHFYLTHFSDQQIDTFLWRREHALESLRNPADPDWAAAQHRARAIYWEIRRHPRVSELARNPLMLIIISLIREERARLPEQRVEFYECAVKTLMDTWNSWRGSAGQRAHGQRLPAHRLVQAWAAVALWVRKEKPTGVVGRAELARHLAKVLVEREIDEESAEETAQSYLSAAAARAGLLDERSHGFFAFWHPTFEEYLAAVELALPARRVVERLLPLRGDVRFFEVIRLAVGHVGIIQQDQETASDLVRALANEQPGPWERITYANLRHAASCIADGVGVRRSVSEEILRRLSQVVAELPYELIERDFVSLARSLRPGRLDEETISAFSALSGCENVEVRVEVARLLRKAARESVSATSLCERLLSDEVAEVRGNAALALFAADDQRRETLAAVASCAAVDSLFQDALEVVRQARTALRQRLETDLISTDKVVQAIAALLLGMAGRDDAAILDTLFKGLSGDAAAQSEPAKRVLQELAERSQAAAESLVRNAFAPEPAEASEAAQRLCAEARSLCSNLPRNERVIDGLIAFMTREQEGAAAEAERCLDGMFHTSSVVTKRLLERLALCMKRPLSSKSLSFVCYLKRRLDARRHGDAIDAALARFLESDDLELRFQAAAIFENNSYNDKLAVKYHAALHPCLDAGGDLALRSARLLFSSGHERTHLARALLGLLDSDDLSLRESAAALLYRVRQSLEQVREERWQQREESLWKIGQQSSGLSSAERDRVVTALLPCLFLDSEETWHSWELVSLLRKLGPLRESEQRFILTGLTKDRRKRILPSQIFRLFDDVAEADPCSVHHLVAWVGQDPPELRSLELRVLADMAMKADGAAAELAQYLNGRLLWLRLEAAKILLSVASQAAAAEQTLRSLLIQSDSREMRLEAAKLLFHRVPATLRIKFPQGVVREPAEASETRHTGEETARTNVPEPADGQLRQALWPCLLDAEYSIRVETAELLRSSGVPAAEMAEPLLACLDARDWVLRLRCARLLGGVSQHAEAVIQALLSLLPGDVQARASDAPISDGKHRTDLLLPVYIALEAAPLLISLAPDRALGPLLYWVDVPQHQKREEACLFLAQFAAGRQELAKRLVRWLSSDDWQLAHYMIVKTGLIDEAILSAALSGWLDRTAPWSEQSFELVQEIVAQHQDVLPLIIQILRRELSVRRQEAQYRAAHFLWQIGSRDRVVASALVRAVLSEPKIAAERRYFVRFEACDDDPAILAALAEAIESTEPAVSETAYGLLKDLDAHPELRARYLYQRWQSGDAWYQVTTVLAMLDLVQDEATVAAAVSLLDEPGEDDAWELARRVAIAETLLNKGAAVQRALDVIHENLQSDSTKRVFGAASALFHAGRTGPELIAALNRRLALLGPEDTIWRERIEELLHSLAPPVKAPWDPRAEIAQHLETLAGKDARVYGNEAWKKLKSVLQRLNARLYAETKPDDEPVDWWARASSMATRASGLAKHLSPLPPIAAEVLLLHALPDAPSSLLPWLLGPRDTLSELLSQAVARLVSVNGKEPLGRFASAFFFFYLCGS